VIEVHTGSKVCYLWFPC